MTTDIVTLATDQYTKWDDFVDRSPHGTVFHKTWWLLAAGRPFRIYCALDKHGNIEAGIPVHHVRKYGLSRSHTPPLTPRMGPIFDLARHSKPRPALTMMRRRGEDLAKAIPLCDSFLQRVSYGGPDLQGFLWAGFDVRLTYSYRFRLGIDLTLPDGETDLDTVNALLSPLMSKGHKHALTKARRSVTIVRAFEFDRLMSLVKMTFARQGNSYAETHGRIVKRLFDAAAAHDAVKIYVAQDEDGQDSAAAATVCDRRCAYLVMAGGDPQRRSAGGGNLCVLHALTDAFRVGLDFDFEGSQIRGVEEHYRGWGPPAVPIYEIVKQTTKGMLANTLASRARGLRRAT